MNLGCSKIESLIPFCVEGGLDESRRTEVHAHAAECPRCSETLQLQTSLHRAIAERSGFELPSHYYEGVLAEIHRQLPAQPSRIAIRRRRTLSREAIASAAMFFFGFVWLWSAWVPKASDKSTSPPSNMSPATTQVVQVASNAHQVGKPAKPERQIVWVKGVGLLSADSPILKMPASVRRDLGIAALAVSPIAIHFLSK